MDLVNILARILDSERHFNGSADLIITVDHDLSRLWTRILDVRSSDRGSQSFRGNLTFSLLCAGCHAVEKMTRNSNALKRDGSKFFRVLRGLIYYRFSAMIQREPL